MIDLGRFRWLRIEPVDAWFFRDGRPSNRGEDQSDLESEFPPHAATVVGALRAGLARQNGWSGRGSWGDKSARLRDVLGDGFDNLGQLSFLGPFLMVNDNILWPMPRHVVGRMLEIDDPKTGQPIRRFQPTGILAPSAPVCCDVAANSVRLPELPRSASRSSEGAGNKPPQSPDGVFVTSAGLTKLLAGNLPASDDCYRQDNLFTLESRVGIRRDAVTRTTGANDMYSPRYVRLNRGVSLLQGVAGTPDGWKLPILMPLGGESRMASVEPIESTPEFPLASSNNSSSRLAISLSPAQFSDRWWGAGPGDEACLLAKELTGTIAAVALDRPRRIGGWDSSAQTPRPLTPFAPAGTVWWIDDSTDVASGLMKFGQSLAYGYGLSLMSGNP